MATDFSLPLRDRLAAADLLKSHMKLQQEAQTLPPQPIIQEAPERRATQQKLRNLLESDQSEANVGAPNP